MPSATNPSRPQQVNRPSNRKPQRRAPLTSTQVVFAVILAVGLMLAINFSDRIAEDRQLQTVRETILQEIRLLEREQIQLLNELSFVASDDYVEAWAHSEGQMVRPGEMLVRPIPVASRLQPTPVAPIIAPIETTPPEPEPWQLWWALFFDTEPPMVE